MKTKNVKHEKIKQKVCIIGLGYVGLPLAVLCAGKGFEVTGLERNSRIISLTNKGISHIDDKKLKKGVRQAGKRLKATNDAKLALSDADIAVVCVPTPVDENKMPELSALKSACRTIAEHLHKWQVVIIESTIYPGTTDEIAKPILETSGLKAGRDFYLAHCPERINPGDRKWHLENIPRVLGAADKKSAAKAKTFYNKILKSNVLVLKSPKEAEAVKIMENTFRDVNIAFINELAMSFAELGIDIVDVIKGAGTKPFGFMPFYPGPGVGGHCIPVDPYYLIERARQKGFEHKFLKLARNINDSMAGYVVRLTLKALKESGARLEKAKIAFLGLSYKADIGDTRESPSFIILSQLKALGARLFVFDPYVKGKSNVKSISEALKNADCVVLVTNHKTFLPRLTASALRRSGIKAVVDCRNSLDKEAIQKAGIVYKGIGR